MQPEGSWPQSQELTLWLFHNMIPFLRWGVVNTSPNLQAGEPPLVGDFLFNIFLATLHIWVRSSIRNLRTRQAVVTGTH